jgi:hypothetical protein
MKNRAYVSVRRIPKFTLLGGTVLLFALALVAVAPPRWRPPLARGIRPRTADLQNKVRATQISVRDASRSLP